MTNDSKNNVTVTNWDACYNSGDDMIVLSCEVATIDSSPTITGVGILLNNHAGITLATCYVELSNGTASATPSLNLSTGSLQVGDAVTGVVTGEADKDHFLVEQDLVIGTC
jgi:hypothetical protein